MGCGEGASVGNVIGCGVAVVVGCGVAPSVWVGVLLAIGTGAPAGGGRGLSGKGFRGLSSAGVCTRGRVVGTRRGGRANRGNDGLRSRCCGRMDGGSPSGQRRADCRCLGQVGNRRCGARRGCVNDYLCAGRSGGWWRSAFTGRHQGSCQYAQQSDPMNRCWPILCKKAPDHTSQLLPQRGIAVKCPPPNNIAVLVCVGAKPSDDVKRCMGSKVGGRPRIYGQPAAASLRCAHPPSPLGRVW